MSQLSGEELKKLRESKGITLDKAAADLRLRGDLLRALESCDGVEILPDIYQKLSLQMYARYLGKSLPGNRPACSTKQKVPLSPPVELAYSTKLDPKVPQTRRRKFGVATLVAAAALIFLASGLWSLNAKLARLTPKTTPPAVETAATAKTETPDTEMVAPTPMTDHEILPPEQVTLDEELYLSLTPPHPPAEINWH